MPTVSANVARTRLASSTECHQRSSESPKNTAQSRCEAGSALTRFTAHIGPMGNAQGVLRQGTGRRTSGAACPAAPMSMPPGGSPGSPAFPRSTPRTRAPAGRACFSSGSRAMRPGSSVLATIGLLFVAALLTLRDPVLHHLGGSEVGIPPRIPVRSPAPLKASRQRRCARHSEAHSAMRSLTSASTAWGRGFIHRFLLRGPDSARRRGGEGASCRLAFSAQRTRSTARRDTGIGAELLLVGRWHATPRSQRTSRLTTQAPSPYSPRCSAASSWSPYSSTRPMPSLTSSLPQATAH